MPERRDDKQVIAAASDQQGGLEAAKHRYTTALSREPDDAEAAFNLGNVLAALHRPQEAADCFTRAVTCKPCFTEAFQNLGLTLLWLSRHDEALVSLRRAILLQPAHGEALCCLGSALEALHRSEEALACYRQAVAITPGNAAAYTAMGSVLRQLGKIGPAIGAIRQALAFEPCSAPLHTCLGNILEAADRPEDAMTCYETALAIDPAFADAHYGLGNCLAALRRRQEAIVLYHRALTLRPHFAEAHNNLGIALQGQDRLSQAIGHYCTAIVIKPNDASFYNNLGGALQVQDRAEEAVAWYRRAISLAPDYAEAHNNMGIALTDAGDLDEAYRAFVRAIALEPHRGCFHRMLADTGRVTPGGPDLRRMEALARDIAALPETDRMELHFALGKVYGDCARHEQSFQHLLAGNRLKRRSVTYDEAGTLASFARIRAVFTAELLARGPEMGEPSPLPVFIVGMPRSGTTLVEQILASHPQIFGAGELLDMPRLVEGLGPDFPEAAALLPTERIRRLGTAYLDGLRRRAPSAARIVDKMLDNAKLLGLIHLALPAARIIHVHRDPLDTCLSCFSKLFIDPQPFAYDLAELGRYYRAHEALMAHWHQVLPPGVMLEVRYEDVVADVEGQARRILAHCGMAWDAGCLAFHRTRRVVRTASATQVRQPLYASAVGRWHVYGELARPLFDALEQSDMLAASG